MTGYVLSPRAERDLEWGLTQAESYLQELKAGVRRLAVAPKLGMPCDHLRAGYRRYSVGSHVIFYRPTATGIDVVRILHGRMDFRRHL